MQPDLLIPPHNIDAEQAVLGGLMISPNAWDEVAGIITPADFYRLEHRLIWKHVSRLAANGNPIDVITVAETLEAEKELEKAGGMQYLGSLSLNVPSAANIKHYAAIVRDHAILRELIAIGMEVTASAQAKATGAEEIAERAEARIFALMQHRDSNEPVTLEVAMEEAILHIEQRYSGAAIAMPTGLTDLDEVLGGGLHRGSLNIIGARPKAGKTALACSMALSAARADGVVYFASLEMPRREIANRMIAITSGCRTDAVMRDSGAMAAVTDAIGYLKTRKIIIDDECALSVQKLRSRCRKVQRKQGLHIVVVDYLQLMKGDGDTREQEVASISRGLKALAKELDCPVLCLAQLNRECESRMDKRPHMGDLRESGSIEADADLVMMLYRDEVYNKHSDLQGIAEILIRANRHGPAADVMCHFDGSITKFNNLGREWVRPQAQQKKGRGI